MKLGRLKPPPDATEDEANLANEALARTVDVMLQRVHHASAHSVLSAANRIREEICGKLTDKREISGPGGKPQVIVIRKMGSESDE
jgi:hypothetical protein